MVESKAARDAPVDESTGSIFDIWQVKGVVV